MDFKAETVPFNRQLLLLLTTFTNMYIRYYTYWMVFEWDEAKNLSNQKKHNVSFEDATTVFTDPLAFIRPDPGSHSEERWQIIGKVHGLVIALVVYVVKDEDAEVYRLVSARKVTTHERKAYENS